MESLPSADRSATDSCQFSAGIRSAIQERWALHNEQAAAQRDKRRAELERKAHEDLERVARMDGGNGQGVCGARAPIR